MTQFVGCIDIHNGQVKQIVGNTLTNESKELKTNFVSTHDSSYYADLYKQNNVQKCHIIKLGPNCDEAATKAIQTWPHNLQIGGGINLDNCSEWIKLGAAKVIVTSFLFPNGTLDLTRLINLEKLVTKDKLVIDLSCRRKGNGWVVAMNKWQTLTNVELNKETIQMLSKYCSEFLVHAADVEGLCKGIDEELVTKLAEWSDLPVVYAGGGRCIEDLDLVNKLSNGKVDLTLGSCLDIFGGQVKFSDAVEWNNRHKFA